MKKYLLIGTMLLAVLFAIGLLAMPNSNVQAQTGGPGCVDAAGAPVACTPTPEPGGGSGGNPGGGNPATVATTTPLPITNPTSISESAGSVTCAGGADATWMLNCIQNLVNACGGAGGVSTIDPPAEGGGITVNCSVDYLIIDPTIPSISVAPTATPLPDENYLGSCSNADGNVFDCFDRYECEDGLLVIEVDLYAPGGTKYDFYCIPDENVPQLDLPLTMPDPVGEDNNWTGGCNSGDGLDACLDLMSSACSEDGGDVSIWYDDDGAGVYCQNQSEAGQVVPTTTPLPITAPEEGSTSGNNLKQLGIATIVIVMLISLIVIVRKAVNRRVEVKLSK